MLLNVVDLLLILLVLLLLQCYFPLNELALDMVLNLPLPPLIREHG